MLPSVLEANPQPLFTERLALQPLGPEHAPALFAAFRDPAVYEFVPDDPPRAAADLEARYRRTSAGPGTQEERWWNWAVAPCERPDAPFGTVETSIRCDTRRAVIGYVLGRAAWGRGFASEACRAVLAHLYGNLFPATVEAFIDTRNTRSIRLAERLGFERQETLVGADYFKGTASDEYRYRLPTATPASA